MAQKRMFTKDVTQSDAFLDMPMSAQCLYFHLNMDADDDGFVDSPSRIMRTIGCAKDDMNILIAKRFILVFESGVIVIKHWKLHNYIAKDRYKSTLYVDEMEQLEINDQKIYTERKGDNKGLIEPCIQDVYSSYAQSSIDKSRLEESREEYKQELFCEILLKDGTSHKVSNSDIEEYKNTFANIDVIGEIKKMALWCKDNPGKRKTKSGIRKFISGWLSRSNPQAITSNNYKDLNTLPDWMHEDIQTTEAEEQQTAKELEEAMALLGGSE